MATYKIIGARYVRKYTAPAATPVYAAAVDAARAAAGLCETPWEPSAVRDAGLTVHGADENVENRDRFDAALFCAGHENNAHRAYANATCYVYTFPDSMLDGQGCVRGADGQPASLESFAARVTSDPYNAAGARISLVTSGLPAIPLCDGIRAGDAYAEGVAPRVTRDVDGAAYWYCNTEDVSLAPSGDLPLRKYLFVFVLLEDYRAVRGNWMEGCSYMENLCTLETSRPIEGWNQGETYDLSIDRREYAVCRDGVLPSLTSAATGVRTLTLGRNGDPAADGRGESAATVPPVPPPPEYYADITPLRGAAAASGGVTAEESVVGLRTLYAKFYGGSLDEVPADVVKSARTGAAFTVRSDGDSWRMAVSVCVVPFALPRAYRARQVRLDWGGTSANCGRFNVWMRGGYSPDVPANMDVGLFEADGDSVDGWTLLGTIDAAADSRTKTLDIPDAAGLDGHSATILLTAFANLDALSPTDATLATFPRGTCAALDIDLANGTADGLDETWKPDITLIG